MIYVLKYHSYIKDDKIKVKDYLSDVLKVSTNCLNDLY